MTYVVLSGARENADEEFLTELLCGAEGCHVTPLIVNNNKYLARRSPSSLSQSYQCVNNTPTSSQMCLQQHLGFQDCQHSTNNSFGLPCLAGWQRPPERKKERKKERSNTTRNRKWFRLPASPAHCRLLAAFICCKINKWSFLAGHRENIVWELLGTQHFYPLWPPSSLQGKVKWASLKLGAFFTQQLYVMYVLVLRPN